jgi:hypothetical protein
MGVVRYLVSPGAKGVRTALPMLEGVQIATAYVRGMELPGLEARET